MPDPVKSVVGSSGIKEDDGKILCPRFSKKSRNRLRISADCIVEMILDFDELFKKRPKQLCLDQRGMSDSVVMVK